MKFFSAADGFRLSYSHTGTVTGIPLICVPGGPLMPADYLTDLGGLDQLAELILLHLRGSERSTPVSPSARRCDNVAEDLEALRLHLGLERLNLLGHSAGANIVLRYAERHPDRVERLILITPSTRAVGIEIGDDARAAAARFRKDEPWYADAAAALARIQSGEGSDSDWAAITPFSYGRWDDAARAFDARMERSRNPDAAQHFGADGAFDPSTTRAALSTLPVPVVVLAGGADVGNPVPAMQELTDLFPRGELVVQEGAGHFPWVDDPGAFRSLIAPHLAATPR